MIRLGFDGYVVVEKAKEWATGARHTTLMIRPPVEDQPKRPKFYAEVRLDQQGVLDLIEELKRQL